jgi:hypothetical protein
MRAVGPVGLPLLSAGIAALLGLFGAYRMLRAEPPPREEQTDFVLLVRTSPAVLEMHPEADRSPELDLPSP